MDSTKFESEKQRRERNWLKIRIGVLRLVWLVGPPYFVAPSAAVCKFKRPSCQLQIEGSPSICMKSSLLALLRYATVLTGYHRGPEKEIKSTVENYRTPNIVIDV